MLLGLLVAFSRVALSVHYLGDVVVGSYVGIVAAILMHRAFAAKGIEVKL
jgi:membrane-associated phospholipid phosphatase